MDTLTCDSCYFFRPTKTDLSEGQCRRNPPLVIFDHDEYKFITIFPTIEQPKETYCGEFAEEV